MSFFVNSAGNKIQGFGKKQKTAKIPAFASISALLNIKISNQTEPGNKNINKLDKAHITCLNNKNIDLPIKYLIKNFITSVGAGPCACPCSEGSP
ncbi:Uncharacterized protein dnl_19910 [Desulfonema limicola]|uniref:Uncharacterized protein n=1 Tax=Desulfonema limicola TaxID=45656 RepID=A0A975B6H6_9BACT|nr:hypothetical protein [Desulfonema limicola]QTA79714.1 Uncharacterized protein dnl_19910 [Desulfonema limicola]